MRRGPRGADVFVVGFFGVLVGGGRGRGEEAFVFGLGGRGGARGRGARGGQDDAVGAQVGREGSGEGDQARFRGVGSEEGVPVVEGAGEDVLFGEGGEGEGCGEGG